MFHYGLSFLLVTLPAALFIFVFTGMLLGRQEMFRITRKNVVVGSSGIFLIAASIKIAFWAMDGLTLGFIAVLYVVAAVIEAVFFQISIKEIPKLLLRQGMAFALLFVTRGVAASFFGGALPPNNRPVILGNGLFSFVCSIPALAYEVFILFILLSNYFGVYDINPWREIRKEPIYKGITIVFFAVNIAITVASTYALIINKTLHTANLGLWIKVLLIDTLLLIPFLTLGVFS